KNIILADYLIDDNPKQLEIFEGKSIMFTASHNVNEHRFERVSGWRDVKNYFNSIEK
ncbi:5'(3')-deoxyribonucleotidase, partial [Staphylococcus epidermidis]|nr:5'(3')-deoxyribonucleotidase [Staphylococcus epidermidis]